MAIVTDLPNSRSPRGSSAAGATGAELVAEIGRVSENFARWAFYLSLLVVPLLIVSPDAMYGYADVPRVAAVRVLAGALAALMVTNGAAHLWQRGGISLWPVSVAGRLTMGLVAAIATFLVANVASAALSVSVSSSVLGAYPGSDSADLYSLLSYATIGLAAAVYLRRRRHFILAMGVMALAGTLASLYGAAQYAGADPLHFDRFSVNSDRTPLTFGNPSFAGSFLTMSAFATAGLFMFGARRSRWFSIVLWGIFTVQVFALATAASRGSWVGVAAGAIVFAFLIARGWRWHRPWRRLLALAVPFVAVFVALMFISSDTSPDQPAQRVQSLNSDLVTGGLNGRLSTWNATLDLVIERPWLEGESSSFTIRTLFGYGPDTFRFAYQQVAPDEHVASVMPHAHNNVLNNLVELGAVGLAAWLAMTVLVCLVAGRLAVSKDSVFWVRTLAATLVAAYAAHTVDQLANTPRASDALAMWAITGAVIALAVHVRLQGARTSGMASGQRPGSISRLSALTPVFAIPAVMALIAVTWLGNVGHLRADFEAAKLQEAMMRGVSVSELSATAGSASSIAPDVPTYHTLEAMALESGVSAAAPGSQLHSQFLNDTVRARVRAASSGIHVSEQFALARSLYSASASQPDLLPDAVAAYERVVELTPRYWAAWLEMAAVYGRSGRLSEGEEALRTAGDLLRKQAQVTRDDPSTLASFASTHTLLGLEPGTYFP